MHSSRDMRNRIGTPVYAGSGASLQARSAFLRLRGLVSEFSADVLTRVAALFLLQILAGLLSPVAAQTTAPGTVISNVAEATFVRGASTAATA